MKFDGIILVMSGLGAEDLIYNWIHVLQVSFIIEASITQSEGVWSQNVLKSSRLSCDFQQLTVT